MKELTDTPNVRPNWIVISLQLEVTINNNFAFFMQSENPTFSFNPPPPLEPMTETRPYKTSSNHEPISVVLC